MPSARVRRGLPRARWAGLAVFVGYAGTAFLYFGLRLLLERGRQYVGYGSDPQIFIWAFAWWPHAISLGENPFVTHAIWAPAGVNLAWVTSIPGLALLFAPLTLLAGPVASYNVAAVLMPCLAAWTAFVLCRYLTRALWPSLVGGYLFGFSSYLLGQEEGHPHMTAVFLVPLIALVVLRYLDGGLGGRALALRVGPLLALQLLFSTELLLTLTIALAVALVIAFAAFPARRRRLAQSLRPLAAAYALAGLLTAPFDYYALTGLQSNSFHSPDAFGTDLLNFAVPTRLALLSYRWATSIAFNFAGNDSEQGAYLGVPTLLILVLFAWRGRRTQGRIFLLASLGVAALATLGTQLTVDGHAIASMPWTFVARLPVLDNVLPDRLALYTSLIAAVIVALWMAERVSGPLRWLLPALAVVALVPNPSSRVWATSFSIPPFFTDRSYRACLESGETVLPLPVSSGGESMLWQVFDNFRFRLAGGYVASDPPAAFLKQKAIAFVARGNPVPVGETSRLRLYIRAERVTSVVLDRGQAESWSSALARIARPRSMGGVVLYRVAAGAPACAKA